jgi:hypothetical protein
MTKTHTLTRLVFLLSITLAVQMIGLPQPITGPFINFMLILTTLLVSATGGAVLACITPLLAVLRGQLPAPLAAMMPFIIAANLFYVVLFALLRSHRRITAAGYYLANGLAVAAAGLIKSAFIYLAAQVVLPLLVGRSLPAPLLSLMALPQLLTALAGGWSALAFYRLWRVKTQTPNR